MAPHNTKLLQLFYFTSIRYGFELADQITIILTTVLASIGTAAVPAAGIIMLIIILESVGVPSAGVALILGWTESWIWLEPPLM